MLGAPHWADAAIAMPTAHADNRRLNDGVVANVYTVQQQAGCPIEQKIKINPKLRLAAQWQTDDVLNNRALDGDIGSDGSTATDRARAAGYAGAVAETVAINPALAINGVEIMNQWYYRPDYYATMAMLGGRASRSRGADLAASVEIDLADAAAGTTLEVPFQVAVTCTHCDGGGAEPGSAVTTCPTCGGAGRLQHVSRSVFGEFVQTQACPACGGSGRKIETPCSVCDGAGRVVEERRIEVTIHRASMTASASPER